MAAAMAGPRRDFTRAHSCLCAALAALPDDHPACDALRAAAVALFTGDQRLAAFVSWPAPDLSEAADLVSDPGKLGEIARAMVARVEAARIGGAAHV